jgi:hypothetical protein
MDKKIVISSVAKRPQAADISVSKKISPPMARGIFAEKRRR